MNMATATNQWFGVVVRRQNQCRRQLVAHTIGGYGNKYGEKIMKWDGCGVNVRVGLTHRRGCVTGGNALTCALFSWTQHPHAITN